MSQTAVDDIAAKLGVDSYDVFERNLVNVEDKTRAGVYAEEMKIAAKLMDWKAKWHPHGKGDKKGSVVSGWVWPSIPGAAADIRRPAW